MVARTFHTAAASMSTMSGRLIAAALIEKARNPDSARSHLLKLSARGHDALTTVYAAWTDMDRLVEELLSEARARHLAEPTRELRFALGGRPPGPAMEE